MDRQTEGTKEGRTDGRTEHSHKEVPPLNNVIDLMEDCMVSKVLLQKYIGFIRVNVKRVQMYYSVCVKVHVIEV